MFHALLNRRSFHLYERPMNCNIFMQKCTKTEETTYIHTQNSGCLGWSPPWQKKVVGNEKLVSKESTSQICIHSHKQNTLLIPNIMHLLKESKNPIWRTLNPTRKWEKFCSTKLCYESVFFFSFFIPIPQMRPELHQCNILLSFPLNYDTSVLLQCLLRNSTSHLHLTTAASPKTLRLLCPLS